MRTTTRGVDTLCGMSYSYVSGVTMQTGNHVLEASENGSITIDELPTTFTALEDTQGVETITSTTSS